MRSTDDDPGPDFNSLAAKRLAFRLGQALRSERRRRMTGIRALAAKAGVATGTIHNVESGEPATIETYARVAKALNRELSMDLTLPGRPSSPRDGTDLVHALMGEVQMATLRPHGFRLAVDEPWQHFHFAGRADVLESDPQQRALLHLENRTAFPDVQDAIGRFATKRRYLATALGPSLGFAGLPRTQTHVMVALWSNEVMRVLRRDPETFQVTCPDPPDAFLQWWAGHPPLDSVTTTLVLFDPFASGRRQRFLSLDAARARVHDYADAAERLRARR